MFKKISLISLLSAYFIQPVWAINAPIERYGEAAAWTRKWQAWRRGEAVKWHIVQLGDSHTAGGFFSDALREALKAEWGKGGVGVVYPKQLKHQKIYGIRLLENNWQTLTVRQGEHDLPLGGVLLRSRDESPVMMTGASSAAEGVQSVKMMMKPYHTASHLQIMDNEGNKISLPAWEAGAWQTWTFQAVLPLQVRAAVGERWDLGLIQLDNQLDRGVSVSALGINGAQWSSWQTWRQDWARDLADTQADMVILAYGTNEAFAAGLNVGETAQIWRQGIQRIRQKQPESAILILGAPESLTNFAGQCGTRAPRLDDVQRMQQSLAQEMGVWFWSWEAAMGGRCSMKTWQNKKLAQKDGVHFTRAGYEQLGKALAAAMLGG